MPAVAEAGRVYRRCACRSEETGRQLGARCPHRTEPGHGRWYFAVMVGGAEGRRQGTTGATPAGRLRLPGGARPHAVVWDEAREKAWRNTGIRPRVAVWDVPHVARFLEAVQDDPLFALWWLVALRGPRRGDIAGLRWEDIDLFAGELTIREQVILIDGVGYLGPPKSAAGVRVLALDEVSVRKI